MISNVFCKIGSSGAWEVFIAVYSAHFQALPTLRAMAFSWFNFQCQNQHLAPRSAFSQLLGILPLASFNVMKLCRKMKLKTKFFFFFQKYIDPSVYIFQNAIFPQSL